MTWRPWADRSAAGSTVCSSPPASSPAMAWPLLADASGAGIIAGGAGFGRRAGRGLAPDRLLVGPVGPPRLAAWRLQAVALGHVLGVDRGRDHVVLEHVVLVGVAPARVALVAAGPRHAGQPRIAATPAGARAARGPDRALEHHAGDGELRPVRGHVTDVQARERERQADAHQRPPGDPTEPTSQRTLQRCRAAHRRSIASSPAELALGLGPDRVDDRGQPPLAQPELVV